jgi:histidinol dehydrogenase
LGDYSAGVNHILPTNRAARYTGGLSVRDFIKFQTSLHVDPGGFAEIAPPAEVLSQAEGLEGHAQACRNRRSTGSKNQL